jgi:hypothetical protein
MVQVHPEPHSLLLRTYNQPLRDFPSKVSFKSCNCSHVIELRDHFRVLVMINLIRNAYLIKRCLVFIDVLLRPSTCGGPLKKISKGVCLSTKLNFISQSHIIVLKGTSIIHTFFFCVNQIFILCAHII